MDVELLEKNDTGKGEPNSKSEEFCSMCEL